MRTFSLNLSDETYDALKTAADRDGLPMADLVRPAIEDAAYAALLRRYTPEGGAAFMTEEAGAAHLADIDGLHRRAA